MSGISSPLLITDAFHIFVTSTTNNSIINKDLLEPISGNQMHKDADTVLRTKATAKAVRDWCSMSLSN
jgi:hypothetical protein